MRLGIPDVECYRIFCSERRFVGKEDEQYDLMLIRESDGEEVVRIQFMHCTCRREVWTLLQSAVRDLPVVQASLSMYVCYCTAQLNEQKLRDCVRYGLALNHAVGRVTPLVSILLVGWDRGARILLEAGADPNAPTAYGYTPIMCVGVGPAPPSATRVVPMQDVDGVHHPGLAPEHNALVVLRIRMLLDEFGAHQVLVRENSRIRSPVAKRAPKQAARWGPVPSDHRQHFEPPPYSTARSLRGSSQFTQSFVDHKVATLHCTHPAAYTGFTALPLHRPCS